MSFYCILALVNQIFNFWKACWSISCVLSSVFLSKSFFSRVSIDLLNLWIDPLCAQSCDREPLNELRIDPPRSIPLAPTLRNFREKFPAQFFPLRALERNLDRSTKIDTTYLLVKKNSCFVLGLVSFLKEDMRGKIVILCKKKIKIPNF